MYPDLVASVGQGAEGKGIVEVLGILWVDRAGQHPTEVLTAGKLLSCDLPREGLGSTLYLLGVPIGQAILSEDSMHLGGILPSPTEDVDDLTPRVLGMGIPV